jgi:hypothetical protein
VFACHSGLIGAVLCIVNLCPPAAAVLLASISLIFSRAAILS